MVPPEVGGGAPGSSMPAYSAVGNTSAARVAAVTIALLILLSIFITALLWSFFQIKHKTAIIGVWTLMLFTRYSSFTVETRASRYPGAPPVSSHSGNGKVHLRTMNNYLIIKDPAVPSVHTKHTRVRFLPGCLYNISPYQRATRSYRYHRSKYWRTSKCHFGCY